MGSNKHGLEVEKASHMARSSSGCRPRRDLCYSTDNNSRSQSDLLH